jgi:hypothetical protein
MAWTNILGQTRVGIRGVVVSQTQTTSLLLDSYSGAAAAYSLRKLNGSYTGNAIRVRRSSDNTEMNIGFDAGGNLNTIALLAFVGSGDGFVTTWYDQSGNGRNAQQTTAANQPFIVNSGSLYTLNGKAIIRNPNANVIRCLITPMMSNAISRPISIITSGKVYGLPTNGYGNPAWYLGGSVNLGGGSRYEFSVSPSGFGVIRREVSTSTSVSNTSNFNTTFIQQGHFGTSLLTGRFNGTDSTTPISDTNQFTVNSYITLIGANAIATDFMANIGMYEYIFYFTDKTSDRVAIESNINSYYSIYPTDSDAQAFATAASITDGTQLSAVNTLVVDLKAAGVWSKMKVIYPFVGGSATSHKFNLKDPRDLDAAYRLTFVGGWTHSSAGAQSNGTTGYANPNINANQIFTSTDGLMGVYTPSTSLINSSYIYGVSNMADSEWGMYYSSGSLIFGMYRSNSVSSTTTLPGLSAIGMETNGHRSVYKNNSRLISSAAGFISMPQNLKMYLSARNANVNADAFASGLYSFSFISSTLTLTEYSAFYTAVQKYQTTLGRQVGTPVGTSNIITTGMILNLDASNPTSYSGTGTTWIDLVAGNNGTLINGPTYDSTNGGSILFDGVNDRVSTFPSKLPDTSSKTIDVWFKSTSSVRQGLCGTRTNNGIASGWVFTINRTTSGRLSYFHTGSGVAEFSAGITTNTWYNAVVTHDSTTGIAKVYLNGTLLGSSNVGSITSSTYNGVIGDEDETISSCPFKGNIPKVTMYSRVLSDTEVLQNFNATKSRFGL